jgi:hypothetical protein
VVLPVVQQPHGFLPLAGLVQLAALLEVAPVRLDVHEPRRGPRALHLRRRDVHRHIVSTTVDGVAVSTGNCMSLEVSTVTPFVVVPVFLRVWQCLHDTKYKVIQR